MAEVIRAEGLSKSYVMGRVQVPALRGVDLAIETGTFVAITGPSGSGKSTLLNLIGMLDQPSSGRLFVDGRDVSSLSPHERACIRLRQVGFVFQFFNLLPELTVVENVMLPLMMAGRERKASAARAAELLSEVGLGDRLAHRPSELSGGQQQRAAIARALANEPSLVLADEPTANLDSRAGAAVIDLLCGLNAKRGHTIVLVTHEEEWAKRAGRVVTVRDGQVA